MCCVEVCCCCYCFLLLFECWVRTQRLRTHWTQLHACPLISQEAGFPSSFPGKSRVTSLPHNILACGSYFLWSTIYFSLGMQTNKPLWLNHISGTEHTKLTLYLTPPPISLGCYIPTAKCKVWEPENAGQRPVSIFCTGDWIQGFMHSRQTLYYWAISQAESQPL